MGSTVPLHQNHPNLLPAFVVGFVQEIFLDDKEFALALDMFMKCEYLAAGDNDIVTEDEMVSKTKGHIHEHHECLILICNNLENWKSNSKTIILNIFPLLINNK